MVYSYIRVSTDKQTSANQKFEVTKFCEREKITVDKWIMETVSGTKQENERRLGVLLRRIKKDDLIICTELSRLGRNMFMVMNILHKCMQKGCWVWTVKEGYKLGDDIQSKVLAFAFGMAADIERQFISTRTKEALARKKAEGMKVGRRQGSHNRSYKLDKKADLIRDLLEKKVSKNKIAKTCGVSKGTLLRWLNRQASVNSR